MFAFLHRAAVIGHGNQIDPQEFEAARSAVQVLDNVYKLGRPSGDWLVGRTGLLSGEDIDLRPILPVRWIYKLGRSLALEIGEIMSRNRGCGAMSHLY